MIKLYELHDYEVESDVVIRHEQAVRVKHEG